MDMFILDLQHVLDGEKYRTRLSLGCPELIQPLEKFAHGMGFETVSYEMDAEVLMARRSQAETDRAQAFLEAFRLNQLRSLN